MRGKYLASRGSGRRSPQNPAVDLPLFLCSGRREVSAGRRSLPLFGREGSYGNEPVDLSLLGRSTSQVHGLFSVRARGSGLSGTSNQFFF
jgi:hypothetical protein